MTDPVIRVEDVSFSYGVAEGQPVEALRNVSLTIAPGELVALIGRNGSGKTTLAKHLNGLLKPTAGRVLVNGTDTASVPVGELARQVGYVFQNPDHQLFLPTVREEISYGPARLGLHGDLLEQRVEETLRRFDLEAVAGRHPAVLGRGLRRLTALAAIDAMRPRVLVLDEPTGGLDRRFTGRLMGLMQELTASGVAIVLITHDMRLVATSASRVVLIQRGQIAADTTPARLFGHTELLEGSGIHPPQVAELARMFRSQGMPEGICTVEQFVEAWKQLGGGAS